MTGAIASRENQLSRNVRKIMVTSHSRFLPRTSFRLSLCLLLVLSALTVAAQSGRRSVPGSPSVPAPTPPAEAKQPDKTSETKDIKRQEIIVTANRADAFAGIPLYFYDTVLKSCAGRLDDSRSVRVEVVTKYTSRSDAVNAAKAQKEAYVVWLQLRSDAARSNVPGNLSDISIEYTVYEPTTAKVKTQGTCYQGSARAGGVVLSPGSGGNRNEALVESRLRDAAIDAAERILKGLHIASASDIPTH